MRRKTLDPVLNPATPAGAADRRAERQHDEFHDRRRSIGWPATATGAGAVAARRLAAAMAALAKADPATRQRAETVFVQPLRTALDDLRNLFKAQEVTRDNLPADLTRSG